MACLLNEDGTSIDGREKRMLKLFYCEQRALINWWRCDGYVHINRTSEFKSDGLSDF